MTLHPLLLTRPRPSAQAFVERLSTSAQEKLEVVIAPLMEIVATDVTSQIGIGESVIFTSANGVAFAPEGKGRRAFCVGAQTTRHAQDCGWHALQAGDTAEQLIETLLADPLKGPVVHLGGVHTRGDIVQILSEAGIQARHDALYDQQLLALSEAGYAALKRPCIVPVFSPRSAAQLAAQATGKLTRAYIIALSDAVAEPLRGESCANLTVLPAPQAIYMVKVIEKLCLARSLP